MCPSTPSHKCWACPATPKYKCPKCNTKSCSLDCVKKHKEEANCDGLRDKVKFVPMGQFKDMDVVNDFRLLEEVTKQVDKCKRDKLKRSTRQGNEMMVAPRLHKHLQRLQSQARSRGCRVRILPPHFVRRKNNTSAYDFRERIIKWHVELKFINIGQTISLPSVSERTKLWKLISDFVEFKCADDHEDPYQQYRAVSYGGISLYLKAEGQPAPGEPSRHFYPLDMKRSLKTLLKNTRIVEHPIIHVVFTRDEHMYREDQDHILFDEEKESMKESAYSNPDEDANNPTLGDVLSQTDAMQADPEAYKQYFDFYLKYYTSKYAQQGVNPGQPQPLPNPMATQFPNTQNVSSNTFPKRSQVINSTLLSTLRPQQNINYPPQGTQNPNYPPHRPHQNPNPNYIPPNTQKYPNRSYSKNFNQTGSHASHQYQPTNSPLVNRDNVESAKKIKEDLQKELVNPLGGLVAYGDSDSD